MIQKKVHKHFLANGLTVLAVEQKTIPKVSIQLWYNVGSKDELTGEKGIAHLIEHMIFKGTLSLSESDINMITQKLSGYSNAFTSHDYTGYMFDFPTQNWREALPIMADCMRNCTFKPDMLASELKAVIQELKMYNDDYGASLVEEILGAMFPDHPYHHPIIGYKQDLWNLEPDALINFYRKHYIPNNATLVVVGDIDHEELFSLTQKYFGSIAPNPLYKKIEFYHSTDISKQHVTLYRDVQVPIYVAGWVLPGVKEGKDYITDLFSWIFASGMGSRLYTKLVNQLQVATDVDAFTYDLFDGSAFFVCIEPSEGVTQEELNRHITEAISDIRENGITHDEVMRAVRKTEVDYLSVLESTQKQAYALGKYYLALQDEQYLYNYTNYPKEHLQEELKELAINHLRETIMYTGAVLPLPKSEQHFWLLHQEQSDLEDARILQGRTRTLDIEPGKMVHEVIAHPTVPFHFPRAQSAVLKNGLQVLYYHNPEMPKIELILDFKAKYYYDPKNKEGMLNFVADMLLEGTKNYNADTLAQVIESYGMSVTTTPGRILMSLLSEDINEGLALLNEILTEATFTESGVHKVRNQLIAEIKDYWDNATQFIGQLARQVVYKNHPYSKQILGTIESLHTITRDELFECYKKYITPQDSLIIVVGNLDKNIVATLEKHLGQWQGPKVESIEFPAIAPVTSQDINHKINRDQIVLAFAGLSVTRTHPDYDKLLLFDQIFTGGTLGSMNSKLFALRERSGLFYTISGSLIANCNNQPGMIFIKTIVSPDRLEEAEKSISLVIDTAINTLDSQEFKEAKNAVINSLVDNFATNKHTATAFLFLHKFKFEPDYFDKRAQEINNITLEEVKQAVKRYLNSSNMVKIRAGRV